jgi:zinc transporter
MTRMTLAAAPPSLLWAMSFDEQGCGHLLPPEDALPDLDAFGSDFLWLHLDLKAAELGPLVDAGHVGPWALVEAVFCPDEHQRVAVEAEHIGGVVADLARPGAKPDAARRLHFVMGLRSLVSG